jgi:hypothetical protein
MNLESLIREHLLVRGHRQIVLGRDADRLWQASMEKTPGTFAVELHEDPADALWNLLTQGVPVRRARRKSADPLDPAFKHLDVPLIAAEPVSYETTVLPAHDPDLDDLLGDTPSPSPSIDDLLG